MKTRDDIITRFRLSCLTWYEEGRGQKVKMILIDLENLMETENGKPKMRNTTFLQFVVIVL